MRSFHLELRDGVLWRIDSETGEPAAKGPYVPEFRDGAWWVVNSETGEDADGPYPPPSREREANDLDLQWAEGKAGRLNVEHANGELYDKVPEEAHE